jgi:hypothetical protein
MADAVGRLRGARSLRRLVEAHHGGRASSRRRQDRHRPALELCSRRQAVRRRRAARRDLPLLARPPGEHPQAHLAGYAGILQADAYDGYNKLYLADRKPGPIRKRRVGCMRAARYSPWPISRRTHAARPRERRRSRSRRSPSRWCRIDALFAIERSINGKSPEERLAVLRAASRPLVDALMT